MGYEQVTIRIQSKYNMTMNTKERAERLIKEARQLYEETSYKRNQLLGRCNIQWKKLERNKKNLHQYPYDSRNGRENSVLVL